MIRIRTTEKKMKNIEFLQKSIEKWNSQMKKNGITYTIIKEKKYKNTHYLFLNFFQNKYSKN